MDRNDQNLQKFTLTPARNPYHQFFERASYLWLINVQLLQTGVPRILNNRCSHQSVSPGLLVEPPPPRD